MDAPEGSDNTGNKPLAVKVKRDSRGRITSPEDARRLGEMRKFEATGKKIELYNTLLKCVTKSDFERLVNQILTDCFSNNTRLALGSRDMLLKYLLPHKQELDVTVTGKQLTAEEEAEIIRKAIDAKLGL